MSDDLSWPNVRAAVQGLLDGSTHDGHTIRARYDQSANAYGEPVDDVPEVIVIPAPGGEVRWVDRIDNLTLEVFAPRGETAQRVAESVARSLIGANVATPEAFLDTVTATTPVEVPHASATHSKVVMDLRVVTRPL